MANYRLTLLGAFELEVDGRTIVELGTAKAIAMLTYLALEARSDRTPLHRRQTLAALFWPEIGERYALQNLRNTLYRLRHTLQQVDSPQALPLMESTRQTISLNISSLSVDVVELQTLVANVSSHAHERLAACPTCVAHLEQVVALYRGELLAGFSLADAPAFEEWLLLRRELIHQQALLATSRLADIYEMQAMLDDALQVVLRLLELDPYREESHRQLMRIHARKHASHLALAQFQKLQQVFQEEFGSEPSPETRTLVQQIAAGEFDTFTGVERQWNQESKGDRESLTDSAVQRVAIPRIPDHPLTQSLLPPNAPASRPDLSEVPEPGPFYGRVQERELLAKWLRHNGCRVVAILGIGGVGKTSLASLCVHTLAGDADRNKFDFILWRSLLNAPPLAELLPPILQILSDQQLTNAPSSIDEQLRLFIGYLRDKKVLLVLDNAESILGAEQVGAYRPGYEPYGQLIEQMATHQHQSHLLFTSRERPRGFARLERDSQLVQSIQLTGLDEDAGHELLAQRGLHGEAVEKAMLVTRYSGNPLALKLVADTVSELFGGDLGEFLQDNSLIFDDIRTVLDQHFARLTELEQQILFWLAVEREPISPPTLRQNLLRPPRPYEFLEALHGLWRRSLVERQGANFALQNVVTEYLTERLVEVATEEIETGVLFRLHQHALLKAQAKEYIRESQTRLILTPIGEQLVERLGLTALQTQAQQVIADLRTHAPHGRHYAGGNILNLLLSLNIDLTGYDFSQVSIWQADLRRATLREVNFSGVHFANTLFVDTFSGVRALALHPENQLLASAAAGDPLIRLWRLSDGQLLAALPGHSLKGISLAFHPAGHLLASGSEDQTIRLWDITAGRSIRSLHGHQGSVASVAFSQDGALLASGGTDYRVCIWDMDTGELLATLPRHEQWVEGLAFHPRPEDSPYLLATANGNATSLWAMERLSTQSISEQAQRLAVRQIATLQERDARVLSLAFSPDGTLLASSKKNKGISLWHVARRTQLHSLEEYSASRLKGFTTEVNSVAFTPDGQMLASSSEDGVVRLWEVTSGRPVDGLRGHLGPVPAIGISQDNQTLASGGTDGVIRLWELQPPGQRRIIRSMHGSLSQLEGISFSSKNAVADGVLLAAGGGNGLCHIWHIKQPVKTEFSVAEFNNDNSGSTGSNNVGLETVVTYRHLLKGHIGKINAVDFCPDTSMLATAGIDHTVRVWNAESGQCRVVLQEHTDFVNCMVYNRQGTILAGGAGNGIIHLWNVEDGNPYRLRQTLYANDYGVRALAFSADGKTLVSSSDDFVIRLWDVDSGELLGTMPVLASLSRSLNFDSRGERLVVGSIDGFIQVWAVTDRLVLKPSQSFRHAQSSINVVAFSPSGDWLASGAFDTALRIWDPTTGEERHRLSVYTQGIRDLAFWPGSNILATTGSDGLMRLCDAESGTLLQTFRAPGPYEGMNITGATGISAAQRSTLVALGAVED